MWKIHVILTDEVKEFDIYVREGMVVSNGTLLCRPKDEDGVGGLLYAEKVIVMPYSPLDDDAVYEVYASEYPEKWL